VLTLPHHGDDGGRADEADQSVEERLGAQVAVVLLRMLRLWVSTKVAERPRCRQQHAGQVTRLLRSPLLTSSTTTSECIGFNEGEIAAADANATAMLLAADSSP
jgi:hypothetical protein